MDLGPAQPLAEMISWDISWEGGKGGQYVGLTNLLPSCAGCLEILEALISWKPNDLSKPVQG
jgi:hypothetical protein